MRKENLKKERNQRKKPAKKTTKSIIAVFIAVIMVFSACSVGQIAQAQGGKAATVSQQTETCTPGKIGKQELQEIFCRYMKIILALRSLPFTFIPQRVKSTVDSSNSLAEKSGCSPIYAAHRGFSGLYPQNSLIAFEKAAEAGYNAFECDVHTTKDGQLVVIHDDTIDDMTNGTGNVEDYTLSELRSFTLDNGNGIENYPGQLKIPTFEETMEICERYDIIPIIELKKLDTQYMGDLFSILQSHNLTDKAVLISFEFDYLLEARKYSDSVKLMYLLKLVTKKDVDKCIENGNIGIDFDYVYYPLSASAIKYAKDNGLTLGAWTVDNTSVMDILVFSGVKYITTNKILPPKK